MGFALAFLGSALLCAITVIAMITKDALGEAVLGTIFISGVLGWLVGFPLLGVATLRARVLPRWCGVLLIAYFPLFAFLLLWMGRDRARASMAGAGLRALVGKGCGGPAAFACDVSGRSSARTGATGARLAVAAPRYGLEGQTGRLAAALFTRVPGSSVLRRSPRGVFELTALGDRQTFAEWHHADGKG